jgi:hypothetical protein
MKIVCKYVQAVGNALSAALNFDARIACFVCCCSDLKGNGLSGTVPASWGAMTKLRKV